MIFFKNKKSVQYLLAGCVLLFVQLAQAESYISDVPVTNIGSLIEVRPNATAVPFVHSSDIQDQLKKRNDPDEIITKVVFVRYILVTPMVPILTPLMSPSGYLHGDTSVNGFVISDKRSNVDRVTKLIIHMDRPGKDTMEIVEVQFTSAADIVDTIRSIDDVIAKSGIAEYKVSTTDYPKTTGTFL